MYDVKEGRGWKRQDVMISDSSNSAKCLRVKLWNKNATAVTDNQDGCTLTVTNASVDRYNQHTQMNSNELTTV